MKYKDKLKDPRWLERSAEILERDSYTCRRCDDSDGILQVHHLRYFGYIDPWNYGDEDLITLCLFCHRAVGTTTPEEEIYNPWLQYEREKKKILGGFSIPDYSTSISLICNVLFL